MLSRLCGVRIVSTDITTNTKKCIVVNDGQMVLTRWFAKMISVPTEKGKTMDKYTATEQAYKRGYDKGYADGERDAVVLCKHCMFGKLNEANGKYICKANMGLNRMTHANEYCSWGAEKDGGENNG
jgi:hypothetical protein